MSKDDVCTVHPAPGALALSGTVDLVELTGPERIVSVDLGARTITATLPADQQVTLGQRVTLYTDPARVSAFDPGSGGPVTLAPVVAG